MTPNQPFDPGSGGVDWSRLPVPGDDGAARHLAGLALPAVSLPSTGGGLVDLSTLPGRTVLFVYPMTGRPGLALPDGWDAIPGARGCTPQACAYRDRLSQLRDAGADNVAGVSAQSPEDQAEAAARLHLPYPLLSDAGGAFAAALALPRFDVGGRWHLVRMTLIAVDGRIAHVRYPVFPPDADADAVLDWLEGRAAGKGSTPR